MAKPGDNPQRITREQFERAYAQHSGVTVEWLREHGRVAKPCDCRDEYCQGWQMAYTEST